MLKEPINSYGDKMHSEDLLKLIKDRRTVHSYNDKRVDHLLIKGVAECFVNAPNHRHTQPWRLKSASDSQRKQLAELAVQVKSKKIEMTEAKKIALTKKYTTPSHLIALLQTKNSDPFTSKEDYASVACAVMNASLYLWANDVGTKWSSGAVTSHPETYEILGIDSKTNEIVGFLWVGHFDRPPLKPEKLATDAIWIA